jgi:hypothetical protein
MACSRIIKKLNASQSLQLYLIFKPLHSQKNEQE